jgi:hypothetical protein
LLVFASNGQVYFSCKEAVYSEEVNANAVLDADAAMLQGAETIKMRYAPDLLWTNYRRAVEAYSARKMTNPNDVMDAFSGILQTLCAARCIDGLPVSLLDIALLWQPRTRVHRRAGFASWSWAGWIGPVHWYDDGFLKDHERQSRSQTEGVELWTKSHGWIAWYSSLGTNCHTVAFRVDGPPLLRGSEPSRRDELFGEHISKDPATSTPTASLLSDRLQDLENHRQQIRYLQFWTLSVRVKIELDAFAVLRKRSLEPENTGEGLRRFHLIDRRERRCGWVILDESWIGPALKENESVQDFILLSGTTCCEAVGGFLDDTSRRPWNAYNAMMIIWVDGIAERAGLGVVAKSALADPTGTSPNWKEIILG